LAKGLFALFGLKCIAETVAWNLHQGQVADLPLRFTIRKEGMVDFASF